MEALYLLLSVASTVATSSLLSLALALRSLVSLLLPHLSSSSPPPPRSAAAADDEGGSAEELSSSSPAPAPTIRLYEGRVRHERRRPVAHAFDYPVRYALVDLDRAPRLVSSSHLHPDRAREVAGSNGPVYLLTIPESVGYEQNPLSIYYCYDLEEEKEGGGGRGDARRCSIHLKMCIAVVTNTPWGEKVFFTFRPGSDLVAKPLHVSPFMYIVGYARKLECPCE